jgi:hypothetical protein
MVEIEAIGDSTGSMSASPTAAVPFADEIAIVSAFA